MKRVVKNTAFAALLVLTLCTIAAYHIEQLMMAKVTVSVPQDEIVRGVFYEGTVLPLSSLTTRDGNTGVYMIDYVEGVIGQEMVDRFFTFKVEEQDRENISYV